MVLLRQMIVFFIIMLLGYYMARKEVLDEITCKKISWMVVNICCPAMILNCAMSDRIDNNIFLFIVGISVIMYISLIVLGFLMPKILRKKDARIYNLMTIFGNIGFMGFPLVQEMYGEIALLYATIFNLFYNLIMYSYGISAMSGERLSFHNLKKICNVGVISVILTFILYFLRPPLPSVLTQTISSVGSVTGPLSMMLIGASFVDIDLREMFSDIRLIVFTILRYILFPVLFMLILSPLLTDPVIRGTTLVMVGAPAGSMNLIIAQQYGGDVKTASKGIAFTTAACVITLPVLSFLLL